MDPSLPNLIKTKNDRRYFYVRLKYIIWPEIYGDQIPINFPTCKAALDFAKNNCSVNKPVARVYTPEGELIKTFTY